MSNKRKKITGISDTPTDSIRKGTHYRPVLIGADKPLTPIPVERGFVYGDWGDAIYMSRKFQSETISVKTNSTLVKKATFVEPVMLVNSAKWPNDPAIPLSLSANVSGTANSESNSIDTLGYKTAQLYLRVSNITGTWSIFSEQYDRVSKTWAVSAAASFGAITAVGTYFNTLTLGDKLAFKWNMDVAGSITLTLGVILVDHLGGNQAGINQTIYLGSAGVTTISGIPLHPGKSMNFILAEGVDLYAVAETTLDLRVFTL